MSKVLGIDYGAVRIGIALSDDTGTIAFGKSVIDAKNKPVEQIALLVKEENVKCVVVGYPLSLKGGKTQQTVSTDEFIEKLKQAFTVPPFEGISVIAWDERFSSKMAADSMIESGMKKKKRQDKSNLDIISASIMLQSYLDYKKYKPGNPGL